MGAAAFASQTCPICPLGKEWKSLNPLDFLWIPFERTQEEGFCSWGFIWRCVRSYWVWYVGGVGLGDLLQGSQWHFCHRACVNLLETQCFVLSLEVFKLGSSSSCLCKTPPLLSLPGSLGV